VISSLDAEETPTYILSPDSFALQRAVFFSIYIAIGMVRRDMQVHWLFLLVLVNQADMHADVYLTIHVAPFFSDTKEKKRSAEI
jgi:hypothetical protein